MVYQIKAAGLYLFCDIIYCRYVIIATMSFVTIDKSLSDTTFSQSLFSTPDRAKIINHQPLSLDCMKQTETFINGETEN